MQMQLTSLLTAAVYPRISLLLLVAALLLLLIAPSLFCNHSVNII